MNADAIAVRLCRQDLFDRKAPRLGHDHVDRFPVELREELVFGELIDVQLFVKNEVDVSAVRKDLSHGASGVNFTITVIM
jgi:hypothetical protein